MVLVIFLFLCGEGFYVNFVVVVFYCSYLGYIYFVLEFSLCECGIYVCEYVYVCNIIYVYIYEI